MMCRICGEEDRVAYRERSRTILCDSCHEHTPTKVGWEEFRTTIEKISGETLDFHQERVLKDFFSEYKISSYSSVKEYWDACSA